MKIATIVAQPLARLAECEPSDLIWTYHEPAKPTWRPSPAIEGSYARPQEVDPWGPCYTHDPTLVTTLLRECVGAAPLVTAPVTVYLAVYEGLSRSNGWAYYDHAHYAEVPDWWRGPGEKPWEGVIVLNGRRIEIHPAITRYVLPHEYGHLVDFALSVIRYPGDANGQSKLHDDFAKVRGLETGLTYGAGTHHLMPGEVFANDFRAHVLGKEQEFWPHPGKPAWKAGKRVQRWWDRALDDLRAAAKAVQ